ncbi:MAG: hypothetical protein K0S47_3137 [Herbinix sp.]|jgi:hypothetical protein|nr:hypothetical protein [Herbinix sp.]
MKKRLLTITFLCVVLIVLRYQPVWAQTLNQKNENDNNILSSPYTNNEYVKDKTDDTQNSAASDTKYLIENGVLIQGINIENIVIPKGVINIGKDSFRNCTNIKSVIIPEGVTRIDKGAFYGCTSLSDIELPEGLYYIDTDAFMVVPA